jgi:hypothetical protein
MTQIPPENDFTVMGRYLYNLNQQTGSNITWDKISEDEDMLKLFNQYGITDLKTLAANQEIKKSFQSFQNQTQFQFDTTGAFETDEPSIGYVEDKKVRVGRTMGLGYSPEGWTQKDIYKGGYLGEDIPEQPKHLIGRLRATGSAEAQYQPSPNPYVVPDDISPEKVKAQQQALQKKQANWAFNNSGGRMIRLLDSPLQYVKAGIVLSHGEKLPPDYTWFDPVRRITYPEKGYYVDMRAVTGLNWDTPAGAATNLSGEILLDPINLIGGWATKANKGIKVTRGLAAVPASTSKVIDKSVDIFKAARKAKELEVIAPHINKIPAANRGKHVNNIIKGFSGGTPTSTSGYIQAAKNFDVKDVEKAAGSVRRYYAKNQPEMLEVYDAAMSVARGESGKGRALFSLYEMLDDIKAVGTGPDEVLKYLGGAENYDDLVYRYRLLGVKNPLKDKNLAHILKQAKKNPRQINELFKEYTLLSDQIRKGHVGFGAGLASGFGVEGQINILKPKAVREIAGNIVESVESLYNKARYLDANARHIPEVVSIQEGAAASRGLRNFEKTLERMQYGWESEVMRRTSQSKSLRKEVLLDQLETMGIEGKEVLRSVEGIGAPQEIPRDAIMWEKTQQFVNSIRKNKPNNYNEQYFKHGSGTYDPYRGYGRYLDDNWGNLPEDLKDWWMRRPEFKDWETGEMLNVVKHGVRGTAVFDAETSASIALETIEQSEILTDLASTVKFMLDEGYTAEHGMREFGYLENYLPRVAETNAKMQSSMDSMIKYFGSKGRANVAKLGLQYIPEYESMVRRFNNVNMTVGNTAQLARSEEAPKLAKELLGKFTEYATIAEKKGNLKLAAQLEKDAKFFRDMVSVYELRNVPNEREARILRKVLQAGDIEPKDYQKALESGLPTFHRYLGPMEYNERTRGKLGKHINEYMGSKNARRFGYEKGSTAADFNVWSEDLEHILDTRMRKTHGSVTSAKYLGKFVKDFEIPRGRSKKARELYDSAKQLAQQNNSDIVNVHEYIKKGKVNIHGETVAYNNADWLLGKVGKGVHMDKRMVEGMLRLAGAERIMDSGSIFNIAHSKYMQWWARSTLFGGRTTYLYNNAAGDTWKQFVAGVDTWHQSGMPAWQVILPEGKTFGGIGASKSQYAPVGLADDARTWYDPLRGRWMTKKDWMAELTEMDILGGQYASTTFEEAGRHLSQEITPWGHAVKRFTQDKSVENLGKLMKSIPETGVYSLRRGEVPAFRRAAAHIEDVKRAGTYMYFRKQGYAPIDAQSVVYRIHYDYAKQNPLIKSWLPFYYWNSKNISQEFSNALIKPAKYALPGKAVRTPWNEMFGFESFPEDAQSEHTRGAGVNVGEIGGLPLIVNFSQLPPFAAQELTGILNSNDRTEGLEQALKALGGMTEPFIQITAEQIANEEFFSGRSIAGGGKGTIPERGIRDFMGINIQDKPWAQRMVHVAEGFATPLGVVRSAISTIDRMPAPAYMAKLLMGLPLGIENPAAHEFLSLNEESNRINNVIKNRESMLDPLIADDRQTALNEEIKVLKLYKSYLTGQSSDVGEVLEQMAVYNNLAKKAEKHQDFDLQVQMEEAMQKIMEGYKQQAIAREQQRKAVEDQLQQYIP